MIETFLPLLIGLALGIEGPGGAMDRMSADVAGVITGEGATREALVPGSGDGERPAPEDQTPTGRFTTATEVKPILGATRGSWIAVRDYGGQDLLYFTQLLSWRCGLWDIRYGINGAPPETVFPMEPCHEDTATPNALTEIERFLPYVTLPPGEVESVEVVVTYDDGTEESATFPRAAILMP